MQSPGIAPESEKPNIENRKISRKSMPTTPPLLSQETDILVLDIEPEAHQAQKMRWNMEQN